VTVMSSSPNQCDGSSESVVMSADSDATSSDCDTSESNSASSDEFGGVDEGSTYSETLQAVVTSCVQRKAVWL